MLKSYIFAQSQFAGLRDRFAAFRKDEDGAALVEYALIVGLVAVAAIAAMTTLSTNISGALGKIGGHLTTIN